MHEFGYELRLDSNLCAPLVKYTSLLNIYFYLYQGILTNICWSLGILGVEMPEDVKLVC